MKKSVSLLFAMMTILVLVVFCLRTLHPGPSYRPPLPTEGLPRSSRSNASDRSSSDEPATSDMGSPSSQSRALFPSVDANIITTVGRYGTSFERATG